MDGQSIKQTYYNAWALIIPSGLKLGIFVPRRKSSSTFDESLISRLRKSGNRSKCLPSQMPKGNNYERRKVLPHARADSCGVSNNGTASETKNIPIIWIIGPRLLAPSQGKIIDHIHKGLWSASISRIRLVINIAFSPHFIKPLSNDRMTRPLSNNLPIHLHNNRIRTTALNLI